MVSKKKVKKKKVKKKKMFFFFFFFFFFLHFSVFGNWEKGVYFQLGMGPKFDP